MSKNMLIAPSILAADFSCLGQQVTDVVKSGADWIHIDVMDGHFVPNITLGPDIVRCLRPLTKAFFDVHLMITDYEKYIPAFAKAGADLINIHVESGPHLHRGLQQIKSFNIKAGVALNPATPVDTIKHVLDDVDMILLMSVNPGFGGQKFIPETLNKLRELKELVKDRNIDIQVDGGITDENIAEVAAAGANVFVAGSFIFKNDPDNFASTISNLRKIATNSYNHS